MLRDQRPENNKRRKIGTLHCLKTAMTARLRSKPCNEGQEYLDMWALKRDRARWAQTKEQAAEMLKGIKDAIAKVKLPEDEYVSGEGPAKGTRANKTINFGIRSSAGGEPRT